MNDDRVFYDNRKYNIKFIGGSDFGYILSTNTGDLTKKLENDRFLRLKKVDNNRIEFINIDRITEIKSINDDKITHELI